MFIRQIALAIVTLSVAAVLPASAQEATPDGSKAMPHHWQMPSKEDMAAWHAQMCNDRFAHAAGRIAFIEAKLDITDAQRPLFDHWREAVLHDSQTRKDECLAHQHMQGEQPSIVERSAMMQKRLEGRLAALQAEQPALDALYQSLAPQQRAAFDQPHGGFGRDHGDAMHHHNDAHG